MINRLLGIFILIFMSLQGRACGVCGGGFTGNGLGAALPMMNQNLMGIQTQIGQYKYASNLQGTEVEGYVADFYLSNTVSFRKGFQGKNFFQVSVPMVTNLKQDALGNQWIQGMGDVRVSMQTILLNKIDSSSLQNQMLLAGYSVQLPTGRYMVRNQEKQLVPMGLQPGLGAWGHTLEGQYAYSGVKHGFTLHTSASLFSENEMFYKPGFLGQGLITYLYRKNLENGLLMPQVGLSYFQRNATDFLGSNVRNTSYSAVSGQVSLDAFLGSWWFHLQGGIPFWEGKSALQPNQRFQARIGISYFWQ
jgi:hypothetical protein